MISFLQPPYNITSKSAHGKNPRLAFVFTPRALELHPRKSHQSSLGCQQQQPTYNIHHTFSSTQFHQSHNSSPRITTPSARYKSASHHHGSARRVDDSHAPYGKRVGRATDSFLTSIHHPSPLHSSSPVHLRIYFSPRRKLPLSHCPPLHHLRLAFLTIHISHRAPTAREPSAHQLVKTRKTRVPSLAQSTC